MNVQLLIDAIVRQTTVLVAQLATAGGVRAPLSHVANQVFADLAAELERQGLSRKVTAGRSSSDQKTVGTEFGNSVFNKP